MSCLRCGGQMGSTTRPPRAFNRRRKCDQMGERKGCGQSRLCAEAAVRYNGLGRVSSKHGFEPLRPRTNLLRTKHARVISRAPRTALLRSDRQVANLPDGDDSDEEVEEDDVDEDDSVCSDDGGLEWDDEPGTTSSAEAEKTKQRREKADRKFIHRVVCHLMRAGPGDDKAFEDVALPAAYHYITHNRSGVKMSSDAINKRFKYLRGANIIRGWVLSALNEKREADLPNKGNRTGNYHSATAETQKISDGGLRHYAETGGDFRLQVAGVATPGACTKADGSPWDPYSIPDGAKATLTYSTKKSGVITGITYWDSKTFVPGITWGTVDGGHGPTQWTRRRVEGTRPSKIDPVVAPNTARVSEKVTTQEKSSSVKHKTLNGDHWLRGYRLVTQTHNKSKGIQGSVKLKSKSPGQVEVANDLYFVICKLVKKSEKKEEDAGKKKANFFEKKGGKK
ncbi:hypothetical protein THAOC_37380 [Thalassiosira oceanica]|uniref:Uncharacterized protein n=1 Tax=Thalassiosira oceanica TaxID=159749 RepID=K0RC72_THAOC|nr:hypothetical protein THAOC_37380 [Thalassiosira oceanica]|eukprot:EJK44112.1 hypothetical protein THAOC_37380 [Thalassiosira oceanica]